MLYFNHSGGIGDILYSLYFCKELTEKSGATKLNFHIQTNVVDNDMKMYSHPFGNVRMTEGGANFLKPLLEAQEYINEINIDDNVPENSINLDMFRRLPINFLSGDIRNWYYNLVQQHLPRKFYEPIIQAKADTTYKDKVILLYTERYINVKIDYNKLSEFKDKLVFVGTKEEKEIFERKYFPVEYAPITDAYDVACKMMGSKGVVGNESGLYSIAETLKCNRILIAPEIFMFNNSLHPGPHNVHPLGGWAEDVSTNEKLVASIKELIAY